MDNLWFWTRSIGIDGAVIAAIAYGVLHPSAFVLNTGLFFCWVYVVAVIVAISVLKKKREAGELASCVSEMRVRMYSSRVWKVYDRFTDFALPFMLAGFGYWVLGGLLLLSQLALKGRLYEHVQERVEQAASGEEPQASKELSR